MSVDLKNMDSDGKVLMRIWIVFQHVWHYKLKKVKFKKIKMRVLLWRNMADAMFHEGMIISVRGTSFS